MAEEGYFDKEGRNIIKSTEELYISPDLAFQGGESNNTAQSRGVKALNEVINKYMGKRIAVGTHGNIMTIMMSYFDPKYDFTFWKSTSMPDIYRIEFKENSLINVERLWPGM